MKQQSDSHVAHETADNLDIVKDTNSRTLICPSLLRTGNYCTSIIVREYKPAALSCKEHRLILSILAMSFIILFTPIFYSLIAGGIILGDTPQGNADHAIRSYLLTNQTSLDLPDITLSEASHMYDVKKIVWNTSIVFLAILMSFILLGATVPQWFCKGIFFGSIIAIGLILLLFVLSLTAFNTFFTGFHKIFFSQGNWQFPLDSILIQTYPEQFWKNITLQWIVLFVVQAVFGTVFAYTFLKTRLQDFFK